jgi:lipopolysaccharide transport system ATP-binding protein
MSDMVIRARGLGKEYHLGRAVQNHKTFGDTLGDVFLTPVRRLRNVLAGRSAADHGESIWALRDLSFDVERGEVLGVIGRNGAGKSTLLKILSRITDPTEGYVDIRGRIASLLEVGTGFHRELTGRENIFLNGTILGMRKRELDRKFDEIVEFAGVARFVDTPVKHYSSGMYLRLAFAVAAHLEPEILLVDEVLAVGDAEFQKKCLGKMSEVAATGRTVLFVSHNMAAVNRLCSRTLWLEDGRLEREGPTADIVSAYLVSGAGTDGQMSWPEGIANDGIDEFRLYQVEVWQDPGEPTATLDVRRPFVVELRYAITARLPYCRVGFRLCTSDGLVLFEAYDSDEPDHSGPRAPGEYVACCEVPGDLLNAGRYLLTVNAGVPRIKNFLFMEGVLVLDVADTGAVGSHMGTRRLGVIRPRLRWEIESGRRTPSVSVAGGG